MLPDELNREFAAELDRVMLDVLRDSKTVAPRVPVDTGALQSTGHTEPSKIVNGKITADLSYGGFAGAPFNNEVDYAVYVHENMNAHFKRPGAGPKFVEAHFSSRADEIVTRLMNAGHKAADRI